MRSRRLSFVAGWAAGALLAVAGFAAFGTPDAGSEELQAEAAAESIGHTAGAYAGLNFALVGENGATPALAMSVVDDRVMGPIRPPMIGVIADHWYWTVTVAVPWPDTIVPPLIVHT